MSTELPSQLQIAIIGAGVIGPRHARSVQKCSQRGDGAGLLCFVDPRPEAKKTAEEFGVPVFESVRQMINEGHRPDAAIVCTPNVSHVAMGKELLTLGLHVLVEKPLATSSAEGRALIETAKQAGKTLLVGHHRRYNPYVSAAESALDEGRIGRVIALSGLWVTYKPQEYFEEPTGWRAKKGTGGPVLINLIHEVDILQYLLGPIVRVHAEKITPQRNHEVEEGAAILLRFASGIVGTFILSDACPSSHNFESATGENPMIPQAKDPSDIYRIFGTEGTLSVGGMRVERFEEGLEKSWTSELSVEGIAVGDEVPFDEQIKNFVRVIRGEEEPRCTGEDGLRALIVCDSVLRAMETGQAVEIPENT